MATAANDSYTAASGATVYAGRNAALPSWRASMVARTWKKVGTPMSLVNPLNDATLNPLGAGIVGTWQNIASPAPGNWASESFTAITDTWCGGAYREGTGKLYVHGGGHNAYAGNEVLSIDLSVSAPSWAIARPPTGATGYGAGAALYDELEADFVYSNGDPRSAHTYNQTCWVSGVLWHLPSAVFAEPTRENTASHKLFKFTPGSPYGSWTQVSTLPVASQGASWYGAIVHDSSRGQIICSASDNRPVRIWDIVGGTWDVSTDFSGLDGQHRAIYIADEDIVVYLNSIPTKKFAVYKPSTKTFHTPTATGTPPSESGVHHANGVWVPSLGAIVTWAAGGTGFDLLTPPAGDPTTDAWAWSRLEAAGSNTVTPDARTTNGVFGRFFHSEEFNCLGVVTSTTGQVNAFALS